LHIYSYSTRKSGGGITSWYRVQHEGEFRFHDSGVIDERDQHNDVDLGEVEAIWTALSTFECLLTRDTVVVFHGHYRCMDFVRGDRRPHAPAALFFLSQIKIILRERDFRCVPITTQEVGTLLSVTF